MSFRGWERVIVKTENGKVEGIAPLIISASRATDIPAFYAEWFLQRIEKGYVKWINRFNGRSQYVSFEKMRAVVFWTKNAGPIMHYLSEFDSRGINYYFTFTLNDYEKENLEPNVPAIEERTDTFRRLSDRLGRERVVWRFDPLILTRTLTVERLLDKIYTVGQKIHDHTDKLVISFIDIKSYPKVTGNMEAAGFRDCREFTGEDMITIAEGLQKMAGEWNIALGSCAETADLSEFGIVHNKCIDDDLMIKIFGTDEILMDFLGYLPGHGKRQKAFKDPGQRRACGCIPSKDIGQYSTCVHLCSYCYANTSPRNARDNFIMHCRTGKCGEAIL